MDQVHEIFLPGAVVHQFVIPRVIPLPELIPDRVVSLTEHVSAGFYKFHGQQYIAQ